MRRYWLLALIFASGYAMGDTMYRSVAPDGTVTYSDRPQDSTAEIIDVDARRGPPPAAETETEPEPARRPATGLDPVPEGEPTIEELRAQKAQACTDARFQLSHVASTDQLYRQTPETGMVPLSADEVASVRAEAEALVEEWCS